MARNSDDKTVQKIDKTTQDDANQKKYVSASAAKFHRYFHKYVY